jgi:conjugal transfer mating pair stabilization protein TraG
MFTIYTLGDVNMFRQVLNAVAMVFGSGLLSSGSGIGAGSAVLTGLLITLFLSIGAGVLSRFGIGKNFNPAVALVLLAIFYVMAVPKVSVQVEDLYTGNATTVDNLPLGIAIPATIFSTVNYSITNTTETAFSTTDGNYISMTSQGFTNPLRLLLALRRGVADYNPYLVASIKAFTLDCAVGAAAFDPKAFAVSQDAIGYLTTNYHDGLTTYFSAAFPQGSGMSCADSATRIAADADAFLNSPEFQRLLNRNMPTRASPNAATPNVYTRADMDMVYTNLVQPVWGGGQDAAAFMKNALLANAAADAFNCASSSADYASLNQCTTMLTQATEQWKTDATANAGFFTKTMIPAMNIFLATFYAFAPLVFIFAVMASWHGIKILLAYLLFGIWSQTWLPFAAVINFIIQVMVGDEMNRMLAASPNGLTIAVNAEFYDMISTKLAMASDMLGAVPVISLALLTGSVFGLTAVAQRWSGRDYTNEKQGAPDVYAPPAMVAGTPQFSGTAGGVVGDMTRNEGAAISVGSARQVALSRAQAEVDATSNQVTQQFGRVMEKGMSSQATWDHAKALVQETGVTDTSSYKSVLSQARDTAVKYGFKGADADKVAADIAAGISIGGGAVPAKIGSGLKLSSEQTKSAEAAYDEARKTSANTEDARAVQLAVATKGSDTSTFRNTFARTLSEKDTESFSKSLSRLHSAQETKQRLESFSSGMSTQNVLTSQQQAQAIAENRHGVRNAVLNDWAAFSRDVGSDAANSLLAQASRYVDTTKYLSTLPAGEERQAAVAFHALRMASDQGMTGAALPYTQAFDGMAAESPKGIASVNPTAPNMQVEGPAANTEALALAGQRGAEEAVGVGGTVGGKIHQGAPGLSPEEAGALYRGGKNGDVLQHRGEALDAYNQARNDGKTQVAVSQANPKQGHLPTEGVIKR